MSSRLSGGTAVAVALVIALSVQAAPALGQGVSEKQRAQVQCVQTQLNVLGFRKGAITGDLDRTTVEASIAYIDHMRAQSPGWSMAVIGVQNAEEWCQRTAEAHPEVSYYWDSYRNRFGRQTLEAEKQPSSSSSAEEQNPSEQAARTSAWRSASTDDGHCVTVASPTKRDERIVGTGVPQVFIVRTRGESSSQFAIDIAGPVAKSQIFVEIDDVIFPTGTLGSGTRAVLIVRSPDETGKVILNEPSAYGLANKAIVLAMTQGRTLTAHVVVRDGPNVGTVYDEVYSLERFAAAMAASDAACAN